SLVSGLVTMRGASDHGRSVPPELDLYTVVDFSKVWVIADVPEHEVAAVRVGQSADVAIAGRETLQAPITFVSPAVDAATRTIAVRLELANPDLALKEGMFVDVV